MTATSLAPMWTVNQPKVSRGSRGMVKIGSSATTRTSPPPRSTTPASTPARGGTRTVGSFFPSRRRMTARKAASSILPIFMRPRASGGQAGLPLRRLDGVHHEHGHGHRADPARDGRDGRGLLLDRLEVDVADEPEALGGGRVADPVDADVDDDRP